MNVQLSDSRLPLLVTGIAGVAGYNALHYFQARYPGRVIGVRQRNNWRLRGEGIVICDAEDRDGLARLFEKHHFRSVLDCAGNCALKSCELDPEMAWRINVEGARNLLEQTVGRARLVHLSIDLVFSGSPERTDGWSGYRETDLTDPVTVYGRTMVAAEDLILATDPAACVLRISLPMGISFNGHAGAIDWIGSRFKHRRPATLYFDEVRTPTYTDCLNPLFELALAGSLSGLYHAGGPRRLTLYQIAQIVNRVGGYDPGLLIGCPRKMAGPIPPRAGNVAMDSRKLEAALERTQNTACPRGRGQGTRLGTQLGPADLIPLFCPWPFDERLVPTHREWHYERTPEIPGSSEFLAEVLYRNPLRRTRDAAEGAA